MSEWLIPIAIVCVAGVFFFGKDKVVDWIKAVKEAKKEIQKV